MTVVLFVIAQAIAVAFRRRGNPKSDRERFDDPIKYAATRFTTAFLALTRSPRLTGPEREALRELLTALLDFEFIAPEALARRAALVYNGAVTMPPLTFQNSLEELALREKFFTDSQKFRVDVRGYLKKKPVPDEIALEWPA